MATKPPSSFTAGHDSPFEAVERDLKAETDEAQHGKLRDIIHTHYPAGSLIFRELDPWGPVFLITKGKVELYRKVDGKKIPLAVLGPNSVFGEMSLIEHRVRSATAHAIEETECLMLSKEVFEKKLEALDPFMRGIFRVMAETIRKMTDEKAEKR